MNTLCSNTLNELQKLLLRQKTVVFLIISALVPGGAAALLGFGQGTLGVFVVNPTSLPILLLGLFSAVLLPLFIFSAAADLFSGEMGDRTLKLTLTRPITRLKVYVSKNLAVGLYTIVSLAITFTAAFISGFFIDRDALLMETFFESLLAYSVALIPMLVLAITAAFLAQFFKNSGAALTTAVFVYLTGKAVALIFPTWAKVVPFYYTDWHLMWVGSVVSPDKLIQGFLIMLSYSLILFALGFYLFDKNDL